MGTRSDYYLGRGPDAEWLGSRTYDGHPERILPALDLGDDPTQAAFRAAVERLFAANDDVTRPDEGWPWPWDDSQTTDYAYAFEDGQVYVSAFGYAWRTGTEVERNLASWAAHQADPDNVPEPPELWVEAKTASFSNMAARRNKDLIFARSGLIIVGTP